jgi:hypothetical protein
MLKTAHVGVTVYFHPVEGATFFDGLQVFVREVSQSQKSDEI